MRRRWLFFLCVTIIIPFISCMAEEHTEIPNMVGMGVLLNATPYKDVDLQVFPMPIVWWQKDRFFIRASRTGIIITKPEDKMLEVSLFLQPRFMGYDADDSQALSGMSDRNWSLDGGLGLSWMIPNTPEMFFELTFTADLLSEHKGQEVTVALDKLFDFKPLFIKPQLGIEWQSKKLVDYYYGVNYSEARLDRPTYSPDESMNPFVQLDCYFALSKSWLLISRFAAHFLDNEISDSPIVDEDVAMVGVIGLTRIF